MKIQRIKFAVRFSAAAVFLLLLSSLAADAQQQKTTGSEYTLSHGIVVGGGAGGAGGDFALTSTTGQTAAGASAATIFGLSVGFWNFSLPAQISVSGRVMTFNGQGIRGVSVTLTDDGGKTQIAQTGTFGRYSFENLTVGETYTLSVAARKYSFDAPTRTFTAVQDVGGLNFIAAL